MDLKRKATKKKHQVQKVHNGQIMC